MANSRTFTDSELLTAALINQYLVHQVPTAGDPYDTGWLDMVLPGDKVANGSGYIPRARRVGIWVYGDGRITRAAGSDQTWATLPVGVPGPSRIVEIGDINGLNSDDRLFISQSGTMSSQGVASGAINLNFAFSYMVG